MKKINIGIVLIVICLIGLCIYSYLFEKQRKQDIQDIEKTVDEYFEVLNKYSVLKEGDRDIDKHLSVNDYEDYFKQMKDELLDFVAEESKDYMYEIYKNNIEEQIYGKYRFLDFKKEKDYFKNINFFDEYVRLNVNLKVYMNGKTKKNCVWNEETKEYIGTNQEMLSYVDSERGATDVIVLKKENGKFKVVYHLIIAIQGMVETENNIIPEMVEFMGN